MAAASVAAWAAQVMKERAMQDLNGELQGLRERFEAIRGHL